MSIGKKQIEVIDYSKNFINKIDKSNIKSYLSNICYFALWSENSGYAKIKLFLNGWQYSIKYIYLLLKSFYNISLSENYEVLTNYGNSNKDKILILSWCFKNNFNKDGSIHDRYFGESSNEVKNSHWIIISMDGYVPDNLNENITVIKVKKNPLSILNFLNFIKVAIKKLIIYRFSFKKIFHYFNFHSSLAHIVSKVVKDEILNKDYKVLLLPYEGQPFQLTSIAEVKKYKKNIKTIGYIHSLLTPNPCEFIFRKGSPDLILTHGEGVSEILKKNLSWPKDQIIFTESLRYKEDLTKKFSNMIFTPLEIHDYQIYLSEFKNILKKSPEGYFPILKIKTHPTIDLNKDTKQLNFKNNLNNLIKIYSNRFSSKSIKSNISIFFGVTASIFEALESDTEEALHICSDPIFEAHSQEIWNYLIVNRESKNSFIYRLSEKGKYIVFGKNEKMLEKILSKFSYI
tara:strand:+ start:142 stop:1515 length:1374 start_codon:yes stop_codon:yes gene_type:complete